MHESIADTIEALNVKLTGHYRILLESMGLHRFAKVLQICETGVMEKQRERRDQTYWLTWKEIYEYPKDTSNGYQRIYLKSAY